MTANRGFFVTIEGIEGAGKSTLADALAIHFAALGLEVVLTREPGGTRIGDAIRRLLLNDGEGMSARTELLLFEAARSQHVDELIRPALARGEVVICDRFADSSLAYQGHARGFSHSGVQTLNDFATKALKPDVTILLDLPADVGLARQKGLDRISSEGTAFHESVRKGYLALAEAEPDRIKVINARDDSETVLRHALQVIRNASREVKQ